MDLDSDGAKHLILFPTQIYQKKQVIFSHEYNKKPFTVTLAYFSVDLRWKNFIKETLKRWKSAMFCNKTTQIVPFHRNYFFIKFAIRDVIFGKTRNKTETHRR